MLISMNYLSIDLWNKLCWLAYNSVWNIIFTMDSIPRVELVNKLKKIIIEKNIQSIIIWMPYDLYWIDNKQFIKTKKFIDKLRIIFPDIEIEEIDERFTTFESINFLKSIWEKNIKQKKDSLSAYFILESYLQKNSL